MIHTLRVKIVFLIRSLMSNFIARKQLFNKDDPKSADDILGINPLDKKVCNKASLIDVGTKAKILFSGSLIGDEFEEKFQRECLRFYQTAVNYLMENLPHDKKIVKYAQYLLPQKRNESGSTSAISSTVLVITKVCRVFFLEIDNRILG